MILAFCRHPILPELTKPAALDEGFLELPPASARPSIQRALPLAFGRASLVKTSRRGYLKDRQGQGTHRALDGGNTAEDAVSASPKGRFAASRKLNLRKPGGTAV